MEADKARWKAAQIWIKGSVKGLLGAVKAYYGRKVVKAYALWRYNALVLPREEQKRLKYSMNRIKMQISKLIKLIRMHIRENFQDSFWRIFEALQESKEEEKCLFRQDKAISNHTEVRFIQDELDTPLLLGTAAGEGRDNESAVNNKPYSTFAVHECNTQAETWISRRIEELKTENLKISQRISLIESNITTFISEMKGILKFPDPPNSQQRSIPCSATTDNNS